MKAAFRATGQFPRSTFARRDGGKKVVHKDTGGLFPASWEDAPRSAREASDVNRSVHEASHRPDGWIRLRHRRPRTHVGQLGGDEDRSRAADQHHVVHQRLRRDGGAQEPGREGQGQGGRLLPDTQSSARYVQYDAAVPRRRRSRPPASRRTTSRCRTRRAARRRCRRRPKPRSRTAPACCSSTRSTPAVAPRSRPTRRPKGVKTIDYDRLTLNGTASYYVSFNNVEGRQAHRPGLRRLRDRVEREEAAGADHERRPDRQQRDAVQQGLQRGARRRSSRAVPTRRSVSRQVRGTTRRHSPPSSSSTPRTRTSTPWSPPNDGVANAVISGLKTQQVQPKKVPTTGQDATLRGCRTSSPATSA